MNFSFPSSFCMTLPSKSLQLVNMIIFGKSTNYEAPRYVTVSAILLLPLFQSQIVYCPQHCVLEHHQTMWG
jgi:hypothetical protein